MTAPIRTDPTTVRVALDDRSYDIVIGRGLLGSLGGRIAALRPGAKAVIVSDENVARHHLAAIVFKRPNDNRCDARSGHADPGLVVDAGQHAGAGERP